MQHWDPIIGPSKFYALYLQVRLRVRVELVVGLLSTVDHCEPVALMTNDSDETVNVQIVTEGLSRVAKQVSGEA
jgi:hypothetical protein